MLVQVQALVENSHYRRVIAALQELDFVEEVRPPLGLRKPAEYLDGEKLPAERAGGREHQVGFSRAAHPQALEACVVGAALGPQDRAEREVEVVFHVPSRARLPDVKER